MKLDGVVSAQYNAALAMLEAAVKACPDELWADGGRGNAFWRIAYHALLYTHLYLEDSLEAYRPWENHRDEYTFGVWEPWWGYRSFFDDGDGGGYKPQKTWSLAGTTDPTKAAPGSIRGDFGRDWGKAVQENIVHGSDSPESAAREIAIWFPGLA